jgi:hypothetical protein
MLPLKVCAFAAGAHVQQNRNANTMAIMPEKAFERHLMRLGSLDFPAEL